MFDFSATSRLNDGGITPFYSPTIKQSCRFNDNDSAYLHWTQTAGDSRKKWKMSMWFKRGNLDILHDFLVAAGSNKFVAKFTTGNVLEVYHFNGVTYDYRFVTDMKFRDPGSWGHLEIESDTANATSAKQVISQYGVDQLT